MVTQDDIIIPPWRLRQEWSMRTRYGRVKLVLSLPALVVGWVGAGLLIACFMALLALVYLIVETLRFIAGHWPSTYQEIET